MAQADSTGFQTGVRLYSNRIEWKTRVRADDLPLELPERFWVTWFENRERRVAEVQLIPRKTSSVSIAGTEIRIDTAGRGSFLIRDKKLSGVHRLVYLSPFSSDQFPLTEYVRQHLQLRGHDVFWPDRSPKISPTGDYRSLDTRRSGITSCMCAARMRATGCRRI